MDSLFTRQELATIAAALRHYQNEEQGEPDNRTDEIHTLATANNEEISLDHGGIEDLMLKVATLADAEQDVRIPEARKSISIASSGTCMWVLCNDGTIWNNFNTKNMGQPGPWKQVPNIPQDSKLDLTHVDGI